MGSGLELDARPPKNWSHMSKDATELQNTEPVATRPELQETESEAKQA